jgi:cellulose biosynthesis protein BcsQ
MKVITAITPKGGGGKTTVLYCLAKALHDAGKRVLVLDPDTNSSLTRAYERREDFLQDKYGESLDYPTVQPLIPSKHKLRSQIEKLGADYDIVIIDTYGKIEQYHKDVSLFADLVLIPAQPNQSSIENALDTCEYMSSLREENEGKPVYGVTLLNFAKNGVAERQYRKEFKGAMTFNIETRPYGRAYKLADIRGLSVTEMDKETKLSTADREACVNAAIDMRRLCDEIIEVVEML